MNRTVALVAFMVTWKISGYTMQSCDPKQADPISGLCVTPIEFTRSQSFDNKLEATNFAGDTLKTAKRPYAITEVHVYEEMAGAIPKAPVREKHIKDLPPAEKPPVDPVKMPAPPVKK